MTSRIRDGKKLFWSSTAAAALAVAFAAPVAALDKPILAANGMISAGHPLAVQSGLKALQAGGTACDAAVATAATLSVMMTDMMGPLGSGYALIYDADSKDVTTIDYNGVAPLATDPSKFDMEAKRRGILAATVPGNLKGWEEVHQNCGRLPWASLWEDAINYAENGRPLDTDSAFHIRRLISELSIYDTWVNEFLVDGQAPPAGYLHKRPDLAATYKLFAEQGSKALYDGPVGDKLVAYMEKEGGLITKEDLAQYSAKWQEPIQVEYRGYELLGTPPSSSSITWMQMMNILENFDLKELGHNTPEYLRVFAEAAKYAHEDAYRHNADPAFVEVPVDRLLSDEYARQLADEIKSGKVREFKPLEQSYATPSEKINHSTSHMSVVDQWGNAVSMTNTLGTFFGSGNVVEGTGLLLSNGMDWFDIDKNIWTGERPGNLVMAPGKRNRWTLAPGLIFQDGELYMIPGGAGAESTMWGIAQPLANIIDFGMDPQQALDAPRFRYGDLYHYTGGTELYLEPAIPADTAARLTELGYDVPEEGKQRNAARGTTNIILIDPASGAYWGGAAPNGRDFVAGY